MFDKGNQQDQRTDRFALFEAMKNKMDAITQNMSGMAIKDTAQKRLSEDVVKLQIIDVIAICLGTMEGDFYMKRSELDELEKEKRDRIIKKKRFYIHEELLRLDIPELSYVMSKLMREANMGFTYQQESHSAVTRFNEWRRMRR